MSPVLPSLFEPYQQNTIDCNRLEVTHSHFFEKTQKSFVFHFIGKQGFGTILLGGAFTVEGSQNKKISSNIKTTFCRIVFPWCFYKISLLVFLDGAKR